MGNKKYTEIELFNLGDEITEQFKIFYHSFFTKGNTQPTQEFVDVSKKLFSNFDAQQRVDLGEQYFNNFIIISQTLLENKQYALAFNFWIKILGFVKEWENTNKNKTLHKGTPYYFSAVASILQNDFDTAMMSMNNALKEDEKNAPNKWTNLPAYLFLTLNDQYPDQYLKSYVDWIIGFIRNRLNGKGSELEIYKNHYKAKRNGNLTYAQFRKKFLDSQNVSEELKFFFVYSIIRLWHLHRLHKNKLGDDLMAPLIFTNSLFTLILVIDNLLKTWNNPNLQRKKFSEHLHLISIQENWINPQCRYMNYMNDLALNSRRDSNFNNWCKELIRFKGNEYITSNSCRVIGKLESDFVLACGLRNFSAHTIESQSFLWKNYIKILQSVLNCLFKTIELL
jgi:hypothetical protein